MHSFSHPAGELSRYLKMFLSFSVSRTRGEGKCALAATVFLEQAAVLQVILNDDVRHCVEHKLEEKENIHEQH